VDTVEGKIGNVLVQGFGGVAVHEVGGGVKGLDPKGPREICLKQKRAYNVIKRTKSTLSFTVLRRSVRA
jgi:hypothetical protein